MKPDMFSGIHAVLYAFFDGDERLDRALMRRQVDLCVEAGVSGIIALGLATEVTKLDDREKRVVMDWVAEDVGGRLPLGFTIAANSVAAQAAQVEHARSAGADWVILQPPVAGSYPAAEYIDFFRRVAGSTDLPVAIQNAPAYMGRGLSSNDIAHLVASCPNIKAIKAEGPATEIAQLTALTGPDLPVLNGRGGLELLDNLHAGCSGFILAPECVDVALKAYRAYREGRMADAWAAYAAMLPSATFIMQSLESLVCYGKRLFAERAGLVVHDRRPAMIPSEAGLAMLASHVTTLGPFTGC